MCWICQQEELQKLEDHSADWAKLVDSMSNKATGSAKGPDLAEASMAGRVEHGQQGEKLAQVESKGHASEMTKLANDFMRA